MVRRIHSSENDVNLFRRCSFPCVHPYSTGSSAVGYLAFPFNPKDIDPFEGCPRRCLRIRKVIRGVVTTSRAEVNVTDELPPPWYFSFANGHKAALSACRAQKFMLVATIMYMEISDALLSTFHYTNRSPVRVGVTGKVECSSLDPGVEEWLPYRRRKWLNRQVICDRKRMRNVVLAKTELL